MDAVRVSISAAALIALSTAMQAQAQTFPARTVQIVNPTQAGATTDVLVRVLANSLANRLGQQFVIVNRPGAGGAIGTAAVARADADGYTLWFGAVYALSVLTKLKETEAGYTPNALVPDLSDSVERHGDSGATTSLPYKTLADLVKAAQADTRASSTTATRAPARSRISRSRNFSTLPASRSTQFRFVAIPRSSRRLLGDNIDVGGLVQGTAAAARDKLRILGIFSEERHPAFPDVPTVKEQGYDVALRSASAA